MSRKSNLTTLYNTNINQLVLQAQFKLLIKNNFLIKSLVELFNRKKIYLLNPSFILSNNTIIFSGSLFYCASKLQKYRKKKCFELKENKVKQNLLGCLLKQTCSFTCLKTQLVVLNNKIEKNIALLLYQNLKVYLQILFVRRFYFFFDAIKIFSLFLSGFISSQVLLNILAEVFKNIQKKKHSKFFVFVKDIFKLMSQKSSFKNAKFFVIGFKFVISGRIKGKQKASTVKFSSGKLGLQSLVSNIEFSKSQVYTKNCGVYGFKLWINKLIIN
jgi:hypothetical protein